MYYDKEDYYTTAPCIITKWTKKGVKWEVIGYASNTHFNVRIEWWRRKVAFEDIKFINEKDKEKFNMSKLKNNKKKFSL